MEFFDNYIFNFLRELHNTDLTKLQGLIKRVKLKKNDIYISEGDYHYKIFYIKKGLLRAYVNNEMGEEKTLYFRWEKEFGADPKCFFEKKPAKLTWKALEDTTVLEVNYQHIEDMSKNNTSLLKMRIKFNNKVVSAMNERVESFVLLSPEKRLEELLQQKPELCERIPDKYLASFLGITPVSFSRIRKRLGH